MNIYVTEEAARWYKEELDIQKTAHIRFYVRYGGFGGLVPGFSLGVSLDSPHEIHTAYETENMTFYVEAKDAWYFEGKDLKVEVDKKLNEPVFTYI
ncbi:HesB/YadR/YfhF family protein [Virgibacillus oceani]|uniref:FeS cluster biogenesis domain-containing protein n=1 Tax=Virgibacillus oceani TaxID=1479511 RepID=A0A917HGJ1_9BACI|nr:HesB/YadR/YfhF family protein [Virgibacillus oceani]GGG77839.1 hypothetical protein GCM10011398_23800 [Virgibacillus oceani]